MRLPLSFLALLLAPVALQAQEIIAADRPGQTASPTVIPARRVQVEMGALRVTDDAGTGAVTTWSLPALLLRFGVLPTMELRAGAEYRTIETGDTLDQVRGIASVSLGTKVAIAQEDGALPELGLLVQLGLPVGDTLFAPEYITPTLALAARTSLTRDGTINLYGSIGGSWDGISGAGSGSYGLALWGAPTAQFGLFGELYGTMTAGLPPAHTASGGVYLLAAPHLQFDLFGGVGLTDAAPQYFVSVGIAVRQPF